MSRLASASGNAGLKGDAAEGALRFPPTRRLGLRRTSWALSHKRRAVMVMGGGPFFRSSHGLAARRRG